MQPCDSPTLAARPHGASKITRHGVVFTCHAPGAAQVCLVGDFNGWEPAANPMQPGPDGSWTARLELAPGHHQYVFLVDGKPSLVQNCWTRPGAESATAHRHHSV